MAVDKFDNHKCKIRLTVQTEAKANFWEPLTYFFFFTCRVDKQTHMYIHYGIRLFSRIFCKEIRFRTKQKKITAVSAQQNDLSSKSDVDNIFVTCFIIFPFQWKIVFSSNFVIDFTSNCNWVVNRVPKVRLQIDNGVCFCMRCVFTYILYCYRRLFAKKILRSYLNS